MFKVALIKGDGIGPEITDAVTRILKAAGVPMEWTEVKAGLSATDLDPSGLPKETMDIIEDIGIALKGPTTTPVGKGHKSVNVTLRKHFELYANVRHARSLPGVKTRFDDVDVIIVRENIEDTYGGIEHIQTSDVAQCLKLITRPGSTRISKYAFEMASVTGRKMVHGVHKANIHKLTDGLFLECFYDVAKDYPDIVSKDIIVDNCCMQLVSDPTRFDVLVLPNLMGDIVSDLAAGLVGGLGVAPGGNIGEHCAIFEAVHGSAPDIAGKGIANPTALLLSACEMLKHLGVSGDAERIEKALYKTLEDEIKTGDLGGSAKTLEFADAIIERLDPASVEHHEEPKKFEIDHSKLKFHRARKVDWIGIDIFVEYLDGLPPLPEQVGNLKLKMVSNRGTKVYPGEVPNIYLVDHHRCRYISTDENGEEAKINDQDVLLLVQELSKRNIDWMHVEKLQNFDGVAGYSKAQGE